MHSEWKQQMTRVTLKKTDSVLLIDLPLIVQLVHCTTMFTEVALGVIRTGMFICEWELYIVC